MRDRFVEIVRKKNGGAKEMTCEDCIHYDVCDYDGTTSNFADIPADRCRFFKHKAVVKKKITVRKVERPYEWRALVKRIDEAIEYSEKVIDDKRTPKDIREKYEIRAHTLYDCRRMVWEVFNYSQGFYKKR